MVRVRNANEGRQMKDQIAAVHEVIHQVWIRDIARTHLELSGRSSAFPSRWPHPLVLL